MRVTGGSPARLDRGRPFQASAGVVGQMFTSGSDTGHLPCLLAFPTSHRALTIICDQSKTNTALQLLSRTSSKSVDETVKVKISSVTQLFGTNHIEAGDAVLSSTWLHVAGLLTRWPLQALGNAVCLLHHTGVQRVLDPTLHAAILHASIAGGRALTVDTGFVGVRESLRGVGRYGDRSSNMYRVIIQAQKLSVGQYLGRDRFQSVRLMLR